MTEPTEDVDVKRLAEQLYLAFWERDEWRDKTPLADQTDATRAIWIGIARGPASTISKLEREVERLTPKPCEHEQYHSVVYRRGPLTAADYDEAIRDLENAKTALVDGDNMGCRVCEDGGHSAANCHHNPMVLARKWAAATRLWQCWHCGFIATTADEGRDHFGEDENCEAACRVALREAAEQSNTTLLSALGKAREALGPFAEMSDLWGDDDNYFEPVGRYQDFPEGENHDTGLAVGDFLHAHSVAIELTALLTPSETDK